MSTPSMQRTSQLSSSMSTNLYTTGEHLQHDVSTQRAYLCSDTAPLNPISTPETMLDPTSHAMITSEYYDTIDEAIDNTFRQALHDDEFLGSMMSIGDSTDGSLELDGPDSANGTNGVGKATTNDIPKHINSLPPSNQNTLTAPPAPAQYSYTYPPAQTMQQQLYQHYQAPTGLTQIAPTTFRPFNPPSSQPAGTSQMIINEHPMGSSIAHPPKAPPAPSNAAPIAMETEKPSTNNNNNSHNNNFWDHQPRRGKWTREEEIYADLLIENFEKGHINEKNGCTLRSFLARKLHCAPMRISKKYAGKGIGKMVYVSLANSGRGSSDGIGSATHHSMMQKLKQAEENFYRSCREASLLPYHLLSSTHSQSNGHSHNMAHHPGQTPLAPSAPSAVPQGQVPLQPRIAQPTQQSNTQVQAPAPQAPAAPQTNSAPSTIGAPPSSSQYTFGTHPLQPIPGLEQAYVGYYPPTSQGQTTATFPSTSSQSHLGLDVHTTQFHGGLPQPTSVRGTSSSTQRITSTATGQSGTDGGTAGQSAIKTSAPTPEAPKEERTFVADSTHKESSQVSPTQCTSTNTPSAPGDQSMPGSPRPVIPTSTSQVPSYSNAEVKPTETSSTHVTFATSTYAIPAYSPAPPVTTSQFIPHMRMAGQEPASSVSFSSPTSIPLDVPTDDLRADSYHTFAEQSAFEASQHSAYMYTRWSGGDKMDEDTAVTDENLNFGDPRLWFGWTDHGSTADAHSHDAAKSTTSSNQGTDEIEVDSSSGRRSHEDEPNTMSHHDDSDCSNSSSRKKKRLSLDGESA